MRPFFVLALTAVSFAQTAPQPKPDPNLNAVLWMQTSAEYAAIATQTYRSATLSMRAALEDSNWTAAFEQSTLDFRELPPAVVLDLDETVLDNSAFQARLTREGASYSEDTWRAWVKEARAGAVPGAVAFLHQAAMSGVATVFITNRVCDPKDPADATVKVLQALRVPFAADRLLCRVDKSDKSERRRAVAAKYRILLLIGDDFNDFTSAPGDVAQRADLQKLYQPMWGEKWFVLPNPTYGSWESATGRSVADKVKRLRE